MDRFKFNLQRVLDIRGVQEKIKQNELALEQKKEAEILHKLERFRQEQAAEYHSGRELFNTPTVDIRVLLGHQRYMESLERAIERTVTELTLQRQTVDLARQALIEAARKKKLLDKLREKKLAQFKKEEEAAEQKIVDEIGVWSLSASFIESARGTDAGGEGQ